MDEEEEPSSNVSTTQQQHLDLKSVQPIAKDEKLDDLKLIGDFREVGIVTDSVVLDGVSVGEAVLMVADGDEGFSEAKSPLVVEPVEDEVPFSVEDVPGGGDDDEEEAVPAVVEQVHLQESGIVSQQVHLTVEDFDREANLSVVDETVLSEDGGVKEQVLAAVDEAAAVVQGGEGKVRSLEREEASSEREVEMELEVEKEGKDEMEKKLVVEDEIETTKAVAEDEIDTKEEIETMKAVVVDEMETKEAVTEDVIHSKEEIETNKAVTKDDMESKEVTVDNNMEINKAVMEDEAGRKEEAVVEDDMEIKEAVVKDDIETKEAVPKDVIEAKEAAVLEDEIQSKETMADDEMARKKAMAEDVTETREAAVLEDEIQHEETMAGDAMQKAVRDDEMKTKEAVAEDESQMKETIVDGEMEKEEVVVEDKTQINETMVDDEVDMKALVGDNKTEMKEAMADDKMDTKEAMVDGEMKMKEAVADDEMDTKAAVMQDERETMEAVADDEMETEAETETKDAEEAEMETESEVTETRKSSGKRKRGRPPKVQNKAPVKKIIEEDVCFICFDGGDLVLCDRRGCPKAYHPVCINRDEAFFRSKGRWTCGWHICSNCEKPAHYMCYTCTYSLCKGCIKEVEFFCVRGNTGFCETCRRTVMLIEKNEGNKETLPVDFDDKSSWEYLFKEYWLDLKGKLALTSNELIQARNPWNGSSALVRKEESSEELYDANDDQASDSENSGHLELSSSRKRRAKSRSKSSKDEASSSVTQTVSSSVTQAVGSEGTSTSNDVEWASEELLEFVAHMKNGDKSFLSQYDVQALLLEYIKRNNLRDPRKKSQIVCDSRLTNLFGKARVGHFEMLKLLENHFLLKEDTQADDSQIGNVNTESTQFEADGNSSGLKKDKRRKSRRKGDDREPQTNLDDYAAIDVHNIKLLYLRRNLLEDLLEDSDKFHDKVVGTFVRIRISGSGQKQDMYRLVQVVGTRKAAEPYKTGKRSADVVLEILNLNKTEIISIDTISNQEFSEDECKRLRQSIKCGLINRMTVGEVQDKAMTLHAVRANDLLESEKLRISHLRDRASEQGRRKELRECVEKLQLLNTPEEKARRLEEIPEVHADPNMDPNYESEEDEEPDAKQQDNYMKGRDVAYNRKGWEPISPGKGSLPTIDTWSGTRKHAITSAEPGRNTPTKGSWGKGDGGGDRSNELSWSQGKETHQSNSLDPGAWSGQVVGRSGSSPPVVEDTAQAPLPSGVGLSSNFSETDKMWHYKDPSAKVQGPFSMVQLRKWSTTGYFPDNLRIWRITEKQEDSILLNDALKGKFNKELPLLDKVTVVSQNNGGGAWKGNNSSMSTDITKMNRSWNPSGNDASHVANGTGSFGWTSSATNPSGEQPGYASRGWSSQPHTHSPHPPSFSGQPPRQPPPQGGQSGGRWSSGQNRGNSWNSNRSTGFQSNSGSYGSGKARSVPSIETPNFGGVDQNTRNALSNLPSPTPNDKRDFSDPPSPTPGTTNAGGWSGGKVATVTDQPHGSVSTWVTPGSSHKSGEENHGWGSNFGQKLPSPTPSSTPLPAANDDSSARNLASAFSTADQVVNHPNYGVPPTIDGNNSATVNPWDHNPSMQPPVRPANIGWGTVNNQNPGPAWTPGPENQSVGWLPPPSSANTGWGGPQQGNNAMGGPQQGNNTMGWGAAPPANPTVVQGSLPHGNNGMGWGSPAGNAGRWGNQPNHSGERFPGSRPSWNRQSSFGASGGGGGGRGPSRPKRPGICKFHESGHCKKGAECDYMHT